MNLSTEEGRPERFSGGQLTVAAFEALGVQPMLGRGFREGDDRPGAEPVILLSYDLWRDRYGSAAGHRRHRRSAPTACSATVIGVMPEKFAFPIREALWIPLSIDPLATPRGQGPSYQVIARAQAGRQHRAGEGAGWRPSRPARDASFPRPTAASAPT